ncbi:MAG TPA: LysE family translocator [Caldilineaceae bacterium]|nr:LysE family translocator [Caldilineaceae bacterium]
MAEFLTLIVVHFLAVITPGPEVVLVFKESVAQGRRYATWLSVGIGAGTLLHVAYCLLGIGLIISQSILLFATIKLLGALYLIYLGGRALFAKAAPPTELPVPVSLTAGEQTFAIPRVLIKGFLTSALNPKATLFFLSIFTVLIRHETPLPVKIGYGVWMATVNALTLSGLAALLTMQHVRVPMQRVGFWLEKVMGALLVLIGWRLIATTVGGNRE